MVHREKIKFARTGDKTVDEGLDKLEEAFSRLKPKGILHAVGEKLRTPEGVERRIMTELSGAPFESGISWNEISSKLRRRYSSGVMSEFREDRLQTVDQIVADAKSLGEHMPMDVVSGILKSCRSLEELEHVRDKVERRVMMGEGSFSTMLPAYAVQALMHKQGVHPAGRKAGGRRVLKTAVGLTVAAAAVGAAFLLSKIEFPEKHYTLDHYRETSPRMSAAAERFFPDDPKTRLHALEYLDRLDMTQRWDGSMDVEGRRDGIVQKNWTRYQWDDLRSNILDGRYDFEAAEKYNKAYDRQIAETSATLGALVPKSPTVSSKQLGERLRGFKMVHINEEHYNPKHVQYEGDLIEMLAKDKPLRIGMEHFDEDYQDYLDRYFSGEISMKPLLRRMEANMTSDAFIGLSAKLREYEPMFDRLRALNKSGARIRVIAMERGYDEQEVYAPYDFYLRDRHMSERLSSVVQADRAAGVDARYVTVTGKAHAFCPRHLPAWVKSKTGLDSATIVFGDQSFMTDAHEFLIESGRSGGPDQQLKKEILGSNMFYIESSEKGVEVRDLSKAK